MVLFIKKCPGGAWAGERLLEERDGTFTAFGAVIRFKTVLGTRSFNVTVEIKGFAGAIFVLDANDSEIACRHYYVGATGMAFRHGVAGGYVEKEWNIGTFDAGVFAGIKHGVFVRTVDDVVILFFLLIGIHTNTSFLNVHLAYIHIEVIS